MEKKRFCLSLNSTKSLDIEFKDITFSVRRGRKSEDKQIIKGVSGKFISGELTAIMGPSGAGKTSLLNILTGFQVSGTNGSIRCNNALKIQNGTLQYKKESCYILQDDNLAPLFTVGEIMNIAVMLKIRNITAKEKKFLLEDILDNLGLINCKNTRCQNLSGGQRKRLSVALELIDNPPIMFLDEPTTGLDSSSSTQCVHMMKELARGGRTIVCTIHQPSASLFELFDHVYVLAEGRCVYQGASSNTIPYLSSLGFNCPQYHNPADYMLEVVSGDHGHCTDVLANAAVEWKWRKAVQATQLLDEKLHIIQRDKTVYSTEDRYNTFQKPSEWTRFSVLVRRIGLQIYRDWTVCQLKLLLHVLVGIFLGLNYQNCGVDASKVTNNLSFFFCGVVYLTYTSLMPAVLKFPSELSVLRKERHNNWYKLKTYYAAFLIADIPMQITFAMAYTFASYFISSQPYEWRRFAMVLIILTLVALTSSSLGLVLGTLVNPIHGTFFGAISLALMLCVSGCLIIYTQMSSITYMATYLSFLSFAVEGIMQAVYGYNREPLICPNEVEYCHYISPELLLQDIGMSKENYWIDVVYLLSVLVIFRTAAFCALKRKLSAA